MGDIDRAPDAQSLHRMHRHNCPNCKRDYTCNCHTQPERGSLVCIDCEHGRYDPAVYGGVGEKPEA